MGAGKVVVAGSSNIDLVVKTERIPARGQTLLGTEFLMVPGGKGANQAVAAAKLGAEVFLVAKLGKDIFAEQSLKSFESAGVKTEYVTQTEQAPSGIASIIVDKDGDNIIVVAPGANRKLTPQDVKQAEREMVSAGAVVAQLEIPLDTVYAGAELAQQHNVPFILNPAPAHKLGDDLLKRVTILTPNESEAGVLAGIEVTNGESAVKAAESVLGMGVKSVIITMGKDGYLLADDGGTEFHESIAVTAIDTTAAGDAFTGALAVGVAEGRTLGEAAAFANCAAALSVTKMGAQPSLPTRNEVEEFMRKKNRI
jgi:ribokinase